jgi:hypothetical protein
MIVNDHIPETAGLQNGRNRLGIAPGQHLDLDKAQLAIGVSEKKDLVAIGGYDGPAHLLGGLGVYVLIHEISVPLLERRHYRESAGKRKAPQDKGLL